MNPQQERRAGRDAFKPRGHAWLNVGEVVAFLDHLDADRADAIDHRSHRAAGGGGFEQNGETTLVFLFRYDAAQGDAVLEGVEIDVRPDDRPVDAEDVVAIAVAAALVADQDDAGLAEFALGLARGAALALVKVPRRIDEGVERRRGDLQRIAGLNLIENHYDPSPSYPQRVQITQWIDLFDIGRDRLLDHCLS